MGCDIHVYRERKVDGVWETDTVGHDEGDDYISYESGAGYCGRSYGLFALLSNVRSHGDLPIKPPAEDRGFPDDATEINQACSAQMDSDGHSHGWLNLAELQKLHEDYEQAAVLYEPGKYNFTYFAQCLEDFINQVSKGDYFQDVLPEDGRILFFYDN